MKILVAEDDKKNLENAMDAYKPFIEKGLVKVMYVTDHTEAVTELDKIDVLISDIYMPAKKPLEIMKNLLKKAKIKPRIDGKIEDDFIDEIIRPLAEERDIYSWDFPEDEQKELFKDYLDGNGLEDIFAKDMYDDQDFGKLSLGLYPVGFDLAMKAEEKGKLAILVSTAYSGHGGDGKQFGRCRYIGDKLCAKAWQPSEATYACKSFVSNAIDHSHDKDHEDGSGMDDTIEKKELAWLAALKGAAERLDKKDISDLIELPEFENKERKSIQYKMDEWLGRIKY